MQLDRALNAYLRHITIERGLSEHSIAAYRRDLNGYVDWLAAQDIETTDAITQAVVAAFIAERSAADPPPAATSLARLQSSVRGWHRFLAREGIDQDDPTGRLRPPKTPRRLPKALTIEQVEQRWRRPRRTSPSASAIAPCSSCCTRPVRASPRPSRSMSTTSPMVTCCGCAARATRSASCRWAPTRGRPSTPT
ncbi:hypothetical protein GCM10025863_04460 [Microbacterium suwonense]|uniref:Core-binding (CB) domain-containing protein n=1 Tax=Microbacterium suwonense TaxID=683047 RepID=A0ABM8FQ99_9MICO|nr:hypothetical protein GCM10025863_04460 [Microbacterium suwonense]